MCQYCEKRNNNDFVLMNQTKEYSGIELAVNCQGMLRARYYDISARCYDIFETQDITNIKYCPMCGERFIK